jgi:Spy/CpxP family protein refolding chaperone
VIAAQRSRRGAVRARLAPAILAAVVLALLLVSALAAQRQGTRTRSANLAPDREGLLRNVWWNQPAMIEKLGLETAQRAQMDRYFTAFLDEIEKSRRVLPEAQPAYLEALRRGDWAEARRQSERMAEAQQALSHGQRELKVDVLTLLSEAQRQLLVKDYGHLINQPWLRRLRLGAGSDEDSEEP